jgi:hypothetical protein
MQQTSSRNEGSSGSSSSGEEDPKVYVVPPRDKQAFTQKRKSKTNPGKCMSCKKVSTTLDKVLSERISTVTSKRVATLEALDLAEEDVISDKLDLCNSCKAYAEEAKGIHLYNNPSNP